MRLIDADAFRRNLDEHYPFTKDEQSKHGMADIAKSTVLLVLNSMPTVEERKVGKWVPHPIKEFSREWDVCTACGVGCKRREYEDGGRTEYSYLYCPNCGARMEDGKE